MPVSPHQFNARQWNTTSFSANPTRFLVCNKGDGTFQGTLPHDAYPNSVSVFVGSEKQNDGFTSRSCEAKLYWGDQQLVVTPAASVVDIDVMGADLGFGVPVIALQIKESDSDPEVRYEIYSMDKSPRHLRTITGQDYFSAADATLHGNVEIWTTDAAAVNGLDGLPRGAFDVAPTVVLRFEKGRLIDVSPEFRPYYDHQIKILRGRLKKDSLRAFIKSDGRLSSQTQALSGPPEGALAAKIDVLEIVLAYVYSGREQDAWETLADKWPSADRDRIRTVIEQARLRGLRTQVDGVSHQAASGPSEFPTVYGYALSKGFTPPPNAHVKVVDSAPQQYLMKLEPPRHAKNWNEEKDIEIVIDAAGKVRSARIWQDPRNIGSASMSESLLSHDKEEPDKDWLNVAAGWKYIPAFQNGRPVAFRMKVHVLRNQ